MKDYYQILGVPESSSQEDLRAAFRKLAFQHHPDKNPGHEKAAEARFKEINEAYCVLGDADKRRQYDFARSSGVGAYSQPNFSYSQQDIFNSVFSNPAFYADINRMFAEAGLRFDDEFTRRVFFSGRGVVFHFAWSTGGSGRTYRAPARATAQTGAIQARKPGFLDRMMSRLLASMVRLTFRMLSRSLQQESLDCETDLAISRAEAETGPEKKITYRRNGHRKKLVVKIPPGVETGTKIRLRGMGQRKGATSGDLYLNVRVKE